jgi:hypothetical protein
MFEPELLQGTNHIAQEEDLKGDLQTRISDHIPPYRLGNQTHLIAAIAIQGPLAHPLIAGWGNAVGQFASPKRHHCKTDRDLRVDMFCLVDWFDQPGMTRRDVLDAKEKFLVIPRVVEHLRE